MSLNNCHGSYCSFCVPKGSLPLVSEVPTVLFCQKQEEARYSFAIPSVNALFTLKNCETEYTRCVQRRQSGWNMSRVYLPSQSMRSLHELLHERTTLLAVARCARAKLFSRVNKIKHHLFFERQKDGPVVLSIHHSSAGGPYDHDANEGIPRRKAPSGARLELGGTREQSDKNPKRYLAGIAPLG